MAEGGVRELKVAITMQISVSPRVFDGPLMGTGGPSEENGPQQSPSWLLCQLYAE